MPNIVESYRSIFDDIVKKGGSPALLEYFGNQLITTQVPRVAPNGTVTVKLKYTMALKRRGGLVRLQMLNTNPKTLMQPLKSAGVTVSARSAEPLPEFSLTAQERSLDLRLPRSWLEQHPLTVADLEQERDYLKDLGIKLVLRATERTASVVSASA